MLDSLNNGWLIAGGAALFTVLASGWSHIKSVMQQLASRVITTLTVSGYQAEAIRLYLKREFAASCWGSRAFLGWKLYVQPRRRVQLVSMEVNPPGGKLYWRGWRALWVCRSKDAPDDVEAGVTARTWDDESVNIAFLRGTFDPDQLIVDATEWYNEQVVKNEQTCGRRHYVRHLYGSAGKSGSGEMGSIRLRSPTSYTDINGCMQHRLLQWSFTDLGPELPERGTAFQNIALSPEAESLIEEARHWKDSEDWYKSRGIPWRRGWMLHGPPGTGKTALARAVAEDLDLPVFVYDLASMHNDELQTHWTNMLAAVPCLALIEDIDAVFNKRQNVSGRDRQTLTFDCLLNCLDGIERADGLLVIISTNRIDRVDSALGIPDEYGNSSRPGRIDRVVELHELDNAGRWKIAKRILADWPSECEAAVKSGAGKTGAQFQEHCTHRALQLRFGAKSPGEQTATSTKRPRMPHDREGLAVTAGHAV